MPDATTWRGFLQYSKCEVVANGGNIEGKRIAEVHLQALEALHALESMPDADDFAELAAIPNGGAASGAGGLS